jgi:hypothetical protein
MLDHSKFGAQTVFGPLKTWILHDLDPARFGLARFGSCKIWINQDLDCARFGLARFGSCKICIETLSQNFWSYKI